MSKGRVLIADDEQRYRDDLHRCFQGLGYEVDLAGNYVGAHEFLNAHTYTLVICDNGMPLGGESRPHKTCGLQLLAYAKSRGRNMQTPFVLHTAGDDPETQRLTEHFGGIFRQKDDTKPVDTWCAALLD